MPTWLSSAPRTRTRSLLRSPADLVWFGRVMTFAAATPLLMRIPLPRLLPLLARTAPALREGRAIRAIAFVQTFLRLRRHHPNPCLVRSLTLFHFLRRAGVEVAIHFGIEPGSSNGHAWLSLDGETLLEPSDPPRRFLEMYRYPPLKGGEANGNLRNP